METPKFSSWLELPMDILRSSLERLSFADFNRAKMVCSHWYFCSKQVLKSGPPWLILFPEDGCMVYNPDEDRVSKPKRDFSGIRLANSGKWFFMVDSRSKLYIIDAFSEKRIDLPPLESIKGGRYSLERVGDKEFKEELIDGGNHVIHSVENPRGVLSVDEKKEEYIVVWYFDLTVSSSSYTGFCKNGEDHYREITTHTELVGLADMVLKGDRLYVFTHLRYPRVLDLSGKEGFKNVYERQKLPMALPSKGDFNFEIIRGGEGTYSCSFISACKNIAVTTSGEVLLVHSNFDVQTKHRIFTLYKMDPSLDHDDLSRKTKLVEVDSLGDEALILDLGITVPADHTLGIEPNSIYFTRHNRVCDKERRLLDICVYNLATKTLKRFPRLSELKIKDALWFLPS